MHAVKMQTEPVYILLKMKTILVRVIGDNMAAKSVVNGLKENECLD